MPGEETITKRFAEFRKQLKHNLVLKPKKIQRYQKSCREGHLNISTTLPVQIQNSADLERAAAAQLKSVYFSICTERVLETIHIHSNFTAGEMLQLFGNLPQQVRPPRCDLR